MRRVWIRLSDAESVKKFVYIISRFDTDFELISDKYIIDAKSIMGIFSLDLSKKLQLCFHAQDEESLAITTELQDFLVE